MKSTRDITDALGVPKIAKELGVTTAAVYNTVYAGSFPADWHFVVKKLGSEAGVNVPDRLFRWKTAAKRRKAKRLQSE